MFLLTLVDGASRVPVALVDRTSRDLSAQQGVSFWMKADGEYRVWFQIRDLNAASRDAVSYTHLTLPTSDLV